MWSGEISEYYNHLKDIFEKYGIKADPYEEIKYGLQFNVYVNEVKCLIRVYESKKEGVKCDLSQIKDKNCLGFIEGILQKERRITEDNERESVVGKALVPGFELIGTDESGKGDYFGPLVIAGVHADAKAGKRLMEIGAVDSKTLTDARIHKLSEEIKKICRYSVVAIGNKRYNEMYNEIKNLNRLLAWGHARAIENLLESVECNNVLSDQFGSPELIRNALLEKGKKVNLEQRPRAEENVVVAAASILARNEYVRAMDKLSEKYGMEFPKGCSSLVVDKVREFLLSHGREELANIAKLHFVITQKI